MVLSTYCSKLFQVMSSRRGLYWILHFIQKYWILHLHIHAHSQTHKHTHMHAYRATVCMKLRSMFVQNAVFNFGPCGCSYIDAHTTIKWIKCLLHSLVGCDLVDIWSVKITSTVSCLLFTTRPLDGTVSTVLDITASSRTFPCFRLLSPEHVSLLRW